MKQYFLSMLGRVDSILRHCQLHKLIKSVRTLVGTYSENTVCVMQNIVYDIEHNRIIEVWNKPKNVHRSCEIFFANITVTRMRKLFIDNKSWYLMVVPLSINYIFKPTIHTAYYFFITCMLVINVSYLVYIRCRNDFFQTIKTSIIRKNRKEFVCTCNKFPSDFIIIIVIVSIQKTKINLKNALFTYS